MPFTPDQPSANFVPDSPFTTSVVDAYKSGGLPGVLSAMKQNNDAYNAKEEANPPIAGNPPLAIPAGVLPAAIAKLGAFLGSNAPLRIGTSGAVGAVKGAVDSPQDRVSGALGGGAKGLAIGTGAEALSAGLAGLTKLFGTIRSAMNPAATQDAAQSAIDQTSDALKSSEANNLQEQLGQHSAPLRPQEYIGLDPEIDSILQPHIKAQRQYGEAAGELQIPATDINKIRSRLDSLSRSDAGNTVLNQQLGQKANQLRSQLHDLTPEIDQTYKDWSENLQDARKFDKTNSPISFLASQAPDRQAMIQKASEATGSNLGDISKDLSLTKPVMEAPLSARGLYSLGVKAPISGAMRSLFGNPNLSLIDPRDIQGIAQALKNKSDNP